MRKSISIKSKVIIAFLLFIIIPVAIIGSLSYSDVRDVLANQLEQTNLENIDSVDRYYLLQLTDRIENYLNLYAEDPNIGQVLTNRKYVTELVEEWESSIKSMPDVVSIYMGTIDGDMYMAPDDELPEDYDPRERPWYKDALDNSGKVIWTEPYSDAGTNGMILSAAKHVKGNDGSIGVLSLDVKLDKLMQLLSEIRIGKNGYVILLDRNGDTIVSPEKDDLIKNIKDNTWAKDVLGKYRGSFTIDIDGKEVILSYLTVDKTGWKLIGIMPREELEKEVTPVKDKLGKILVIFIFWGILASLILLFLMDTFFLRPIKDMIELMGKAENGDLSVHSEVKGGDEVGKLLFSFNNMIEGQKGILNQVKETADAVSASSEQASEVARNSHGLSQDQSEAMVELTRTIEDMSKSIADVTCNIGEMAKNSEVITSSMKEMGQAAEDIANSAVDTSEAMSRVAGSLQELDTAITAIKESSDYAREHGENTVEIALQGKKIVENTIQEMENADLAMQDMARVIADLGKAAVQIGEIVEVIEDIAEQTNLLSLNASIEAARAGEHGRGFAVVAGAIGRLAEKSGESTKDIEKLIRQMQNVVENAVSSAVTSTERIKSGAALVADTGNAFTNIYSAIEESTNLIKKIALAANEEYDAYKTITESTIKVSDLTMHVSAASEQQLAAVEEIIRGMERANEISHRVADYSEEQSANSEEISVTATEVNGMAMHVSAASREYKAISEALDEQAKGLLQMVARFKL
ncbi:MAG TPA: methyl-accepting chemotaxis protein [Bacillota bacterium]|nr:methyl-accepting chemotaxis protein [Bacillota bacterium]